MLLIGTTLARVTHTHGAWQDEAAPPVNRGLILAHLKLKVSGVKISRLTCGCVHPLDWELLISESCKTVSGPECFFSVQIPGSLSPKSKLSGCCLLLERSAFKGSGNRRPQDEQSNPPGIRSGVVPAIRLFQWLNYSSTFKDRVGRAR